MHGPKMSLIAAMAAFALSATMAQAASKPDWNGVWVFADSFMDKQDGTFPVAPGRLNLGDPAQAAQFRENLPQLKGAYADKYKATMQAMMSGKPFADTGAECLPQGMPRFWVGPYAYEIIQTPKQINLFQEWNEQTRRIFLDGRKHPDDFDPTYNGHSIGRWEGDVLVVDTAGIREDTGIGGQGSASHSDALHITERFKTIGPDLLEVQMTADDSKAFSAPWIVTYKLRRKPGMEIQPYICAENNRDTVDANGAPQIILQSK